MPKANSTSWWSYTSGSSKSRTPKSAESLGIVYTPVQIVDFIIRSVQALLRREFNASLSDEGVHVLDPS